MTTIKGKLTPIKVQAHCTTAKEPLTVYTSLAVYLWAYKVHTNCTAYLNGETYTINPRACKVIGRA